MWWQKSEAGHDQANQDRRGDGTMSVFTITVVDQVFDKKSAEVQYIAKVLEIAAAELQRGQGTITSGVCCGMNVLGTANSQLGAWTYTPSTTNP
jgi:hypothetical protein